MTSQALFPMLSNDGLSPMKEVVDVSLHEIRVLQYI